VLFAFLGGETQRQLDAYEKLETGSSWVALSSRRRGKQRQLDAYEKFET
jgi:hypothetical protein